MLSHLRKGSGGGAGSAASASPAVAVKSPGGKKATPGAKPLQSPPPLAVSGEVPLSLIVPILLDAHKDREAKRAEHDKQVQIYESAGGKKAQEGAEKKKKPTEPNKCDAAKALNARLQETVKRVSSGGKAGGGGSEGSSGGAPPWTSRGCCPAG